MDNLIFISWSKPVANAVAQALATVIKDVISPAKAWYSSVDIRSGQKWLEVIGGTLSAPETTCAIVIVTKENLREPWLHFEAGAIAYKLGDSRVIPLLVDVDPIDLPATLQQFQARRCIAEEVRTMLLDLAEWLNIVEPRETVDRRLPKYEAEFLAAVADSVKLTRAVPKAENEQLGGEHVSELLLGMRESLKILYGMKAWQKGDGGDLTPDDGRSKFETITRRRFESVRNAIMHWLSVLVDLPTPLRQRGIILLQRTKADLVNLDRTPQNSWAENVNGIEKEFIMLMAEAKVLGIKYVEETDEFRGFPIRVQR